MPGFVYVAVFYEDISMTNIQNTIKRVALIFVLAALSAIMLLGFPKPVSAQRHGGGSYQPSYSHGGARHYPYYPYRGGRYYPYFYYGGWGYYPWWPSFSIVASLPLYYQTIWVGGYPYYYANGTYYAPTAGGYAIVDPPKEAVSPGSPPVVSAPSEDKLFIYPRKGQSEEQQAEDRYQCHRWAVDQTGYDPTKVSGGAPSVQKRGDYQRAMIACLDARGYSAR
jgi:hypothetical protein